MPRVLLPLVLALVLGTAAPALAAPAVTMSVTSGDVRLGDRTTLAGTATDQGMPLAGRQVLLEVRRFPFTGAWETAETTVTDSRGRFSFGPRLDRNHRVRARLPGRPPQNDYDLPEPDTLSRVRTVFVLPSFTLKFRQLRRNVVRITQNYKVPRDVRLRAPTRFYVGPCDLVDGRCTADTAPLRATAKTRRVRAGRYRAAATVRIPASFDGRFRYVSCFAYSKGSGMGDPDLRCPRRSARLG